MQNPKGSQRTQGKASLTKVKVRVDSQRAKDQTYLLRLVYHISRVCLYQTFHYRCRKTSSRRSLLLILEERGKGEAKVKERKMGKEMVKVKARAKVKGLQWTADPTTATQNLIGPIGTRLLSSQIDLLM